MADLLNADIDLTGLVDPFEKDEETARKEYDSYVSSTWTSLTIY